MYHYHQRRILLQQQNELLRAENRAMIHALTSPSMCRSCDGPIISTEFRELWLENARLRSEIYTLTCFIWRLNLFRSLYPAAVTSLTDWHYAVAVMMSLSLKEVVSLAMLHRLWQIFVHEASRASAFVPCDASSLVANLMNHVSVTNYMKSYIVIYSFPFFFLILFVYLGNLEKNLPVNHRRCVYGINNEDCKRY